MDFERGDCETAPILRLRPLDFEPDLVRRDLYNLEIEKVTDPALHTLFRAKRDEIARQITLWRIGTHRGSCTGRCSYTEGSPASRVLPRRNYWRPSQPGCRTRGASRLGHSRRPLARSWTDTVPCTGLPGTRRGARRRLRTDGVVRPAAHPRGRCFRSGPGRALAASRGRHPCGHLPERRQATADAADDRTAWLRRDPGGPCRARRVPDRRTGPTASPGARGAGCRRRQDARGAGFLEIFESLRGDHRLPARTAWYIAMPVVVGGGSVKDAMYLRGITRILEALAEGNSLDVLFVGKLAMDHIPLIQELLEGEVLQRRGSVHDGWTCPAPRSASTGCARARRSRNSMKEKCRHEACVLRP